LWLRLRGVAVANLCSGRLRCALLLLLLLLLLLQLLMLLLLGM